MLTWTNRLNITDETIMAKETISANITDDIGTSSNITQNSTTTKSGSGVTYTDESNWANVTMVRNDSFTMNNASKTHKVIINETTNYSKIVIKSDVQEETAITTTSGDVVTTETMSKTHATTTVELSDNTDTDLSKELVLKTAKMKNNSDNNNVSLFLLRYRITRTPTRQRS